MKALLLTTDSDLVNPRLAWVDAARPVPGPGEVLIAVRACGVCGTDVHCVETGPAGRIKYSGPVAPPVILGHEFAGEVLALGGGATAFREGDLVTSEGMIGCGTCWACRCGHPNQCPELRMVGLTRPGAFAEYICVPGRFCWSLNRLADKLGDRQKACEWGALVEPVSCSYNAIFAAAGGIKPGEHVVVYGAGPVGLGAIALAHLAGAATVTAFEPQPARRALASRMGADEAFDPMDGGLSIHEAILKTTAGHGADLQVECAGAACELVSDIERAFAPGGTLIYLGRTGEKTSFALDRLVSGGNRIIGSRGHVGGGCFSRIIALLSAGKLDLSPMVTARFPMAQAIQAVRRAGMLQDGKVMTYAPAT